MMLLSIAYITCYCFFNSSGSIVVEFKLIFKTAVDEQKALESLRQEIADGRLGSLDVKPDSLILKRKSKGNMFR